MVDAQRVDDAVAHQRQGERMRLLKDLGVLLAHSRQVIDVKEAPVAAGGRVDVEEALAQGRVGPERVGVVSGHVVGHEIEHDPQPRGVRGRGQLPEGLLAAEIRRDPRRVHDVVAVGRAGPRLQRGGQVEVTDAEIAQIGDALARGREAEVGGELQAVGGAQRDAGPTRPSATVTPPAAGS